MRLFLICGCILPVSVALAAQPIDVIIVAGQSNAVGFDAPPRQLPADPIDDEILFWWRCGDPPPDEHDTTSHGWTTLRPQPLGNPIRPRRGRQYGNYAQPEGGFGPEIGLARTIAKQQHRRLAIIKVAFSGTHVAGDWNPHLSADDDNVHEQDCRGACYRSLVDETQRALAALASRGDPQVVALAWVQGESDATAERSPLYQQHIAAMVSALRRDLSSPDLLVMLAVNTKFGGGQNQHLPQVIASQRAYADDDDKAVYIDTAGASIANQVHFDAAGTIEVGNRFAKQLTAYRAARVRNGTQLQS